MEDAATAERKLSPSEKFRLMPDLNVSGMEPFISSGRVERIALKTMAILRENV